MYQLAVAVCTVIVLPFIVIGLVNLIAWLHTPRSVEHEPWRRRGPKSAALEIITRGPELRRTDRERDEKRLAETRLGILEKEKELGALRAEEFRLSLETGRIRDPFRGGVTNACVELPALHGDDLLDASKEKA